MFFTFVKGALLHNVPLTILNLLLFPAMFYFLHVTNPQLVMIALLLHYFMSNFIRLAEKYKEKLEKDTIGFTQRELFIKAIDSRLEEIDAEIDRRNNED